MYKPLLLYVEVTENVGEIVALQVILLPSLGTHFRSFFRSITNAKCSLIWPACSWCWCISCLDGSLLTLLCHGLETALTETECTCGVPYYPSKCAKSVVECCSGVSSKQNSFNSLQLWISWVSFRLVHDLTELLAILCVKLVKIWIHFRKFNWSEVYISLPSNQK